jgi:hypothetical protein
MNSDNKHSLPHGSGDGRHVDVYSYQEGTVEPEKFHEIMQGPEVSPASIEGLRQRLQSQKGY